MLPKISAALSKFVTPIQTTSGGSSAHEKEFVRTQPERKAKIIPFKDPSSDRRPESEDRRAQTEDQGPETDGPSGTAPGPTSDVRPPSSENRPDLGSSFLQLFASLRQNSGSIFKWIGVNGYRLGMKATRRGGRLRKGAMLDTRVE